MAQLPGRQERFGHEETETLVREVKAREHEIFGDARTPPKLPEVKQAWEEVAASVSSSSGITRTAAQCRKRYSDVRRRGKQKLAVNRKQRLETGGGPGNIEDLTPVEDLAASTLSAESIEGFGGLEVGVQHQALLAEDPPEPGTSGVEQGGSCGGRSATNNFEVQGSNAPTQTTPWQHRPGSPAGRLQYAGERAHRNPAQCSAPLEDCRNDRIGQYEGVVTGARIICTHMHDFTCSIANHLYVY
ncbi:myb-related transcription factor, partner of profilin-like [Alosa alosa]|nr:myb-related transcription factor, partner of profilin-like [Alosa alosa]